MGLGNHFGLTGRRVVYLGCSERGWILGHSRVLLAARGDMTLKAAYPHYERSSPTALYWDTRGTNTDYRFSWLTPDQFLTVSKHEILQTLASIYLPWTHLHTRCLPLSVRCVCCSSVLAVWCGGFIGHTFMLSSDTRLLQVFQH